MFITQCIIKIMYHNAVNPECLSRGFYAVAKVLFIQVLKNRCLFFFLVVILDLHLGGEKAKKKFSIATFQTSG